MHEIGHGDEANSVWNRKNRSGNFGHGIKVHIANDLLFAVDFASVYANANDNGAGFQEKTLEIMEIAKSFLFLFSSTYGIIISI